MNAVATDYLMMLHAPIAGAPQRIDDTLTIFHSDSGRVEGPRIKGSILPPTADWLRVVPGGSLRVDARMSIRTDDGADIYAQYGGVIVIAPTDFARMASGETLVGEGMYFITTPVFQTADSRYAWLNRIQAIGRAVALKGGEGGYVRYEVFTVK
ncbi:DUF3237 domain-containing protein [Dongia deserti]|uniref:DUF3237 domain-containing protein n=1 Tax=Dongia deserti TaxID=2268030 RepID=UPI000E64D8B0|nr:DUF3237 domain-containing protein [Dongia deserti]